MPTLAPLFVCLACLGHVRREPAIAEQLQTSLAEMSLKFLKAIDIVSANDSAKTLASLLLALNLSCDLVRQQTFAWKIPSLPACVQRSRTDHMPAARSKRIYMQADFLANFAGKDHLTPQGQIEDNVKQHKLECSNSQDMFNATLPSGMKRQVFNKSDLVSLRVGDRLIADKMNWPFQSAELIHHSAKPVLSTSECVAVIEEAESYSTARGGWDTQRHYSHPTADVRLQELPMSYKFINQVLPTRVYPMIASCFPGVVKDPEKLRIFDMFVIKYDSQKQSYLGVHRDSSLISVTIALNSLEDYEGGGMWIEPLNKVLQLDQGHIVTFASNIRHGGHRVTKGLRYILVGFLLYEDNVEHDRRLLEASQALRAKGYVDQAIKVCHQALTFNPRRQEALNNLGVLQRDIRNYTAALKSFKSALDIEDSYQEGWVNLGVCQGLAGDAKAALATAKHAVQLNAGDSTAQYNLGCAFSQLEDQVGALGCFSQAILLNPMDGDAYHSRGQLKLSQGDLRGALEDLQQAAKISPSSGPIQNDLAVAYYEADMVTEAIDAFQRAVIINPRDSQARDNLVALRNYLRSQ